MKTILKVFCLIIISYGYYFLNLEFGFSIPCLFHKLTNFYCPGCGITRMIFSILKFDFYQAFRFNPFVFCLLILFIFYFFISFFLNLFNKKQIKINNKVYYVIVILLLLFGIVRNIPYFYYLRP